MTATSQAAGVADRGGRDTSKRRELLWLCAVGAGALLISLPFRRAIPWLGDEGLILRAAMVMRDGGALYRDTFELTPPAAHLATLAWLSTFGWTVSALRALSIGLVVTTAIITHIASARVSKAPALSAAVVLIWAMAVQGLSATLTHHAYTTLLSVGALLASLSGRQLLAGTMAGAAGMTTQTRGALTALATLGGAVRRWGDFRGFALGLIIVPSVCLAYVLHAGVWREFWDDVIVWSATHYVGVQALPYGEYADPAMLVFVALYPAIAITTAIAVILDRAILLDIRFTTCAAFAVAALLGTLPRWDAFHLTMMAPLAIPLFALTISKLLLPAGRIIKISAYGVMVIFLTSATTETGARMWGQISSKTVATQAGSVVIDENSADFLRHISIIPLGEKVFFYPYIPMSAFLTNRQHQGTVSAFVPSYTTPEQYNAACQEINHDVDWIAVGLEGIRENSLREIWPKIKDFNPPEKRAFEAVISQSFSEIWSNRNYIILRRNPGSTLNCSNIQVSRNIIHDVTLRGPES